MSDSCFRITNNLSNIEPCVIKKLLSTTYWASDRTEETIKKSLENSICYGITLHDTIIGFGRAVTDYSTMFWLCDIVIDKQYRGKGLGKMLLENILADPRLAGLLGILATNDAHDLYKKYGFFKDNGKFMVKPR
jgi:GNAT superfamily N-acetyltransferase